MPSKAIKAKKKATKKRAQKKQRKIRRKKRAAKRTKKRAAKRSKSKASKKTVKEKITFEQVRSFITIIIPNIHQKNPKKMFLGVLGCLYIEPMFIY